MASSKAFDNIDSSQTGNFEYVSLQSHLKSRLTRLRISDPEIIILKVGTGGSEKRFQLIRSKIRSASPVFKELFGDSRLKTYDLPEDDPEAFALLIQWVLTGTLPSPTTTVESPLDLTKEHTEEILDIIEEFSKTLTKSPSAACLISKIESAIVPVQVNLTAIAAKFREGKYKLRSSVRNDFQALIPLIRLTQGPDAAMGVDSAIKAAHKIDTALSMSDMSRYACKILIPPTAVAIYVNRLERNKGNEAKNLRGYATSINVAILVDKYGINDASDQAMDLVIRYGKNNRAPDYQTILDAYKATGRSSKLRSYMSDLFVYKAFAPSTTDKAPSLEDLIQNHKELAMDFFELSASHRLLGTEGLIHPALGRGCKYHQQAPNTPHSKAQKRKRESGAIDFEAVERVSPAPALANPSLQNDGLNGLREQIVAAIMSQQLADNKTS